MKAKTKTKEDDSKYIRLEKEEGVLGKSDILSVQMGLLKILKAVRNYHKIRLNELKTKTKLFNIIKETNSDIKKIQENIPKLTAPPMKMEKVIRPGVREIRPNKGVSTSADRDLESQLRDIQEKLRALQR